MRLLHIVENIFVKVKMAVATRRVGSDTEMWLLPLQPSWAQ